MTSPAVGQGQEDPRQDAAASGGQPPLPGSLLPEQSGEDTDAAWGEYPERGDDRLSRDRPPHWDDF